MGISVRFLVLGTAGTLLASPVIGQRPDNQILPKSAELQKQGEGLIATGKFNETFKFCHKPRLIPRWANS